MPTPLHRIQVLTRPSLLAQIRTLARGRQRSLSFTCCELLEFALKQAEIKGELEQATKTYGAYATAPDPRTKVAQPWTVEHQPKSTNWWQ